MTELERYEERDAWIPVRQDIGALARELANTPFVGAFRGKAADVFGAILYGHELHLAPLQALQALDFIDGKPTLKAEALRALYFRDGHRLEVLHWDDKRCTVRAERRDGLSAVEITYSMADAQTAGLTNKRNWRQSPKQMLYARATAMAIKAVAPDIALGIEMSDDTEPDRPARANTSVVQLAPVAPEPAPTRPETEPETVEIVTETGIEVVEIESETVPEPRETRAEPPPRPAQLDLITPPQMRKMSALIRELEAQTGERLNRDARRHLITDLASLEHLDSANNLTRDQASRVIDRLEALTTPADAG